MPYYNLKLKLPNSEYVEHNELKMEQLIETMKDVFTNYYGIDDLNINYNTIY